METKINDRFDKTFYFLCGAVLLTFVYIFLITFLPIPAKNERLVDIILGALLGTCLSGAYNYLTGSTIGSQKKDSVIAAAQENIANALASTPTAPNTPSND